MHREVMTRCGEGVERSYARKQAPDFVADMNRRFKQMNLVFYHCDCVARESHSFLTNQ